MRELDLSERLLHLVGIGDVALHREQAVGRAGAAVRDGDPMPGSGEPLRGGQPDASVASCHEH